MNRKSGFKNGTGDEGVEAPVYYYGPYTPGAQPATATPVKTPTASTTQTQATPKNGWITPENKQNLFNTGLNLASQFVQTKIGGGQGTPASNTPEPDSKSGSGSNTILWVAGGLVLVTAVGLIIYKISK